MCSRVCRIFLFLVREQSKEISLIRGEVQDEGRSGSTLVFLNPLTPIFPLFQGWRDQEPYSLDLSNPSVLGFGKRLVVTPVFYV